MSLFRNNIGRGRQDWFPESGQFSLIDDLDAVEYFWTTWPNCLLDKHRAQLIDYD